jgi:hypothetical protein
MIIGPRSDSILAPAEPSRHSIVTPLVIDLSDVIESQEMTSPFIATGSGITTGSGEEHPVRISAATTNKARFIGNPHRS